MMKRNLVLTALLISLNASANSVVDIYGLDKAEGQKILAKYARKVAEIETDMLSVQSHINEKDSERKMIKIANKRHDLMKKIMKENGYLFVDFQTVKYVDEKNTFTSIEIIDKKHQERMRFVSAMPMSNFYNELTHPKKSAPKNDVITTMHQFSDKASDLFMSHQIPMDTSCPVYHCLVGFDHPELKPYLSLFNNAVVRDKKMIIETLRHDKDEERRADAAFLIGHFRDPHEIMTVLAPSVMDKSIEVRNNAMRVISETMRTTKTADIDVMPFLNLLDSPYVTDRNKALNVLLQATRSKQLSELIIEKAGKRLVTLLQLKQPDNWQPAYLILKTVSGRDFGVKNVAAWKQWVSSMG